MGFSISWFSSTPAGLKTQKLGKLCMGLVGLICAGNCAVYTISTKIHTFLLRIKHIRILLITDLKLLLATLESLPSHVIV